MGNNKIFAKIEDHIFFDWVDVAVALIKQRGIHEGHWRAGVAFENHPMMANMTNPTGPSKKVPAQLVTVACVDLKQMKPTEADELTVDAAEVNPRQRLVIAATH